MVDFRDAPAEAAFRAEVRDFLAQEWPPIREKRRREPDAGDRYAMTPAMREWFGTLSAKGWIAPSWPLEYGGAGMSTMNQFVLNEEMAESRAERPNLITIGMVGPTLIGLGTDEQKAEHLPRILSGQVTWCMGYSEPGAGSDLAGLQTRAVKDGDDYVINGQKIWTSGAHHANYMVILTRTDPDAPKHKGITYFIVDMHAPGLSVRPLINMTGSHEFNEVFFDDVRVPARNILGEVNRGWYGAVTTLDNERSSIGAAVGQRQVLEELLRHARDGAGNGTSQLRGVPTLRYDLAERWIEAHGARLLAYRVASMQSRGVLPNYEASMAKLYSQELNQRIFGTALKVCGLYGQLRLEGQKPEVRYGRYAYAYLRAVANTIEGGTSEIQRNIVATRGLGLPRS